MAGRRGNPAWVKGKSGNPEGRRAETYAATKELRSRIHSHMDVTFKAIMDIIADPTAKCSSKVNAIKLLWEYGFAKFPQEFIMSDESIQLSAKDLSADMLKMMIPTIQQKIEERKAANLEAYQDGKKSLALESPKKGKKKP